MSQTPCTTFVNGTNPFTQLMQTPIMTQTKTPGRPAKPAKPAAKRIAQSEDYRTPYVPTMVEASVPDDLVDCGLTITNDPLPFDRRPGVYKYQAVFDRMTPGQALRVKEADVGNVSAALRKYTTTAVRFAKAPAHTKSAQQYTAADGTTDTGYGRVWLLAGESSYPKRKAKK